MSDKNEPIWVESLLSSEEHAIQHKLFPNTVRNSKPIPYDPSHYTGGTWRRGMGKVVPPEEAERFNKNLEKLRELLKTKKFQKRPDYGPENEMKPSNY